VQLGGAGSGEEPIPRVRADSGDEHEPRGRDAEPDRPFQPGQVSEQIAHDSFPTRLDDHDEEERSGGEWCEDCLRFLEANW
jgi:hypothetical protein